jgi:hypothetical protein
MQEKNVGNEEEFASLVAISSRNIAAWQMATGQRKAKSIEAWIEEEGMSEREVHKACQFLLAHPMEWSQEMVWLQDDTLVRIPPEETGSHKLEADFNELKEKWLRETKASSSVVEKFMNQNYQQIIGIGEPAIPLILREMQRRPGHWFWALRAITRQNPVSEEDRGNIPRMTEAWLRWGRLNHHL